MNEELFYKIRNAVADYMRSEGCSCCQNVEAHKKNTQRLAELLNVPKYDDGSGYDFYLYATERKENG